MRGLELRQHILETTTDLFYREGFRACGVDTIAKACKTTKKSLYSYFPTKDHLIAEVLRARHTAWVESVERALSKSRNPIDGILRWFDELELSMRSPKYRGCIFFNAAIEFPEATPEISSIIRENNEYSHRRLLELLRSAGFTMKVSERLASELGVLRRGAQITAMSTGDASAVKHAKSVAKRILDQADIAKQKVY